MLRLFSSRGLAVGPRVYIRVHEGESGILFSAARDSISSASSSRRSLLLFLPVFPSEGIRKRISSVDSYLEPFRRSNNTLHHHPSARSHHTLPLSLQPTEIVDSKEHHRVIYIRARLLLRHGSSGTSRIGGKLDKKASISPEAPERLALSCERVPDGLL